MSGWLLDDATVLLPDGDGLRWLDGGGAEVGWFEPPLAAALGARLRGEPASPLLAALSAQGGPPLEGAVRLDVDALLRQGGWGQLFVELTAQCNESCRHCYAGSSPARTEALDRATVAAALREAGALGFAAVQFTGGEALLCPFLAEACGWAREAGVGAVEVYTNGLALDAARYASLRAHDVAFAVSLYARTPEVHDAVTQVGGSHARTVAAIERALAGGSQVRVGVVLTRPEDVDEARGAADLARGLGVAQVTLDLSRAVGRGGRAGRAVLPLAGEPLQPPSQPLGGHRSAAGRRGGTAAILPDGRVVPCIFARERTLGRVGPEGGLRAALTAPAVRLADAGGAAARLAAAAERLSCAACRRSDALLAPG